MAQQSKTKENENLYKALESVGIRGKAAELYVVSINAGPLPLSQLAHLLSVSRPNLYGLVRQLEAKGLATYSGLTRRANRTFVVEPPSAVAAAMAKQRESLQNTAQALSADLPDLFALYHQGASPTKVKVLVGEEQYRLAIESMFDEVRDELIFFGSIDDFVGSVTPDTFKKLTQRRVARGIRLKSLMLPSERAKQLQARAAQDLRDVKFLKSGMPFDASFQLSVRKVIIWQPKAPLALLIEDEHIVRMLRAMFESLWDYGSKD